MLMISYESSPTRIVPITGAQRDLELSFKLSFAVGNDGESDSGERGTWDDGASKPSVKKESRPWIRAGMGFIDIVTSKPMQP
jgi:hypothetical protein